VLDAATGLLYVGNGQYYDPATGRFLTRDAKPDNTNPYVPWNPIGAIVGPLGLLSMFYSRKRKRGKWDTLLISLVFAGAVAMSLSACGSPPPTGSNNPSPVQTQTPVPIVPAQAQTQVSTGAGTFPAILLSVTASPVATLVLPECPTPMMGTPMPTISNTEPDKMDAGVWGPKSTNLYNLYLRMYREKEDKNGHKTLWWSIYGSDGNFTLVEFVAMVFIREVSLSPGFAGINMNDYVEAMGRHAYQWCKVFSGYDCDSTTNKGTIYFLVEWSQPAKQIEEFCARNVESCPLSDYFQSIYGPDAEIWALNIANGIHNPLPAWKNFDKNALYDAGNRDEQVMKPRKIDMMHNDLKHKAHYESPDGLFFLTTYCETEYLRDAMDRFNAWGCKLEQNSN